MGKSFQDQELEILRNAVDKNQKKSSDFLKLAILHGKKNMFEKKTFWKKPLT